jgi:hypothetical protein
MTPSAVRAGATQPFGNRSAAWATMGLPTLAAHSMQTIRRDF